MAGEKKDKKRFFFIFPLEAFFSIPTKVTSKIHFDDDQRIK